MKLLLFSKRASAAALGVMSVVLTVAGCSRPSTKSPDVSSAVRQSLEQAGFKDVSVDQDRDKGDFVLKEFLHLITLLLLTIFQALLDYLYRDSSAPCELVSSANVTPSPGTL